MAKVEKLLKYQEEDSKLLQIERETASSDERKNFVQAKNYMTTAPDKLKSMDSKASEMSALLEKLKADYEEIAETLEDFDNLDDLLESGADISFYKKNASQMADRLKSIKAEIQNLQKSMKLAVDEYRAFRKKTIEMQDKYAETKKVYQDFKQKKLAEMEEVTKRLAVLEKDIEPEVMTAYKNKRSERIFPILCPVKNDRCSKCGMELSIVGKDKIAGGKVTECENCHRFLYKE